MKKHYRHENNCLNCGATLMGKFCHVCGQENLEIKESFGHMMNHAISDYFHFDHQFFHTLKPLLFKPGFLTKEYMAGKRAQFLHPVKMYIFISVVYFLLVFQSGGAKVVDVENSPSKNSPAATTAKGGLNLNVAGGRPVTQADQKRDRGYVQDSAVKSKVLKSPLFIFDGDSTITQYRASQQKLPETDRDGFFSRRMAEKFLSYNENYGKRAREQFVEDIQHNFPKMMFVLLPLFALFLSITFRKNKEYYVEHLIYTFHFHCFLFLFVSIVLLLEMILPQAWKPAFEWINIATAIYVFWYFYRSLRVVYQRSTFRTITKMIGLTVADIGAMMFCSMLLFFIMMLI
jgi:hypothetical protein